MSTPHLLSFGRGKQIFKEMALLSLISENLLRKIRRYLKLKRCGVNSPAFFIKKHKNSIINGVFVPESLP